jgi:2-pyrone-4,6-dicarboxylate lactonase
LRAATFGRSPGSDAAQPMSSAVSDIPACAPPSKAVRKPSIALPPSSCDCHAHICGPAARYAYYEKRVYTPADCLLPDYRAMLKALGVERAVLVQPSFYATDNTVLVEALTEAGDNFRGIAVVTGDVSDSELQRLHAVGVRGVRVNVVDTREAKGVLPMEQLRALAERVRPLGWHMEFLAHVNEFPDLDRMFANFPVDVVFGHLGYVPTSEGVRSPGFQAFLRLLKERRAWVKLTGPYRISSGDYPFTDTNVFANALFDAAPDRIVWGTDWPHVKASWSIPMPNDGDLADLLATWVPPSLLKRVLVDNPATLYGFEAAP